MTKWYCVLLLIVSHHCVAKLTVVTENFAPAQYLDANNNLVGDAADKVRLALDSAGIDYSPDPKGLLEGTGKSLRHVKVRNANVTSGIAALIAAAREERKQALGIA